MQTFLITNIYINQPHFDFNILQIDGRLTKSIILVSLTKLFNFHHVFTVRLKFDFNYFCKMATFMSKKDEMKLTFYIPY